MAVSLGQKVRLFRTKSGLSQLELETAIDAANGSISRIESGLTNPTKETLDKIIKALKLNKNEVSDILGVVEFGVTKEEIAEAIEIVKDHYSNEKTIGYLLDDKWYVIN